LTSIPLNTLRSLIVAIAFPLVVGIQKNVFFVSDADVWF